MGRKSALTPDQWVLVEQRHFIDGESINSLAKEFGVNESVIRRKIKPNKAEQEKAGKPLPVLALEKFQAEQKQKEIAEEIANLPVVRQNIVNGLAKRLSNISEHLASAAEYGAATAHRLSGIAHTKVQQIDDADPTNDQSIRVLKDVAVLTKMANEASDIGMNLLKANKETIDDLNKRGGDDDMHLMVTFGD